VSGGRELFCLLKGVRFVSQAALSSWRKRICASTGQGENDMAMENAKMQGSTTGSSAKTGHSGPTGVSDLVPAGTEAPDFSLHVTPDQTLSLRELRGKPVILAFYPADWSPVCGDQMALYNEVLPEFQKFGAELLGVSVDGVWCHRAFAEARHLHFPLLADFEPKGAVAQLYGAYRNSDGFSERALFVIDKSGIIAWSYRSPIAVNPGADGILQALEDLPK
jgi:peroxiredoxin